MQIDTVATYMYGAQFQNREFFSLSNNASNEQFSLALQYVSSLAPSALPDKETREGPLCPSRVLDALKSLVKVGLSTRGLLQENLERSLWQWLKNDSDELFLCETLQFNTVRLITLHHIDRQHNSFFQLYRILVGLCYAACL